MTVFNQSGRGKDGEDAEDGEEVLGNPAPTVARHAASTNIVFNWSSAGEKKAIMRRRSPKSSTSALALNQAEDYHAYDVHLFWANVRERVKQQAGSSECGAFLGLPGVES